MSNAPTPEPLDSARAARLIAFARTCAAAVRAVALYPAGHPAVESVLTRLVDTVATITASEPLCATVLPKQLLIDGRAPANPDPALAELAALLHEQRVSDLTVRDAGDATMWLRLLGLIGRPPEEIREAGGIGHLWSEHGGMATAAHLRSVEMREVDYERMLRHRSLGDALTVEEIFARLGSDDPEAMDPAAQALLTEIVGDAEKLELFGLQLAERCAGDRAAHAKALRHLVRQATELVSDLDGAAQTESLRNLAGLLTSLDAATLAEVLRGSATAEGGTDALQAVTDLVEPEGGRRFRLPVGRRRAGRLTAARRGVSGARPGHRRATAVGLAGRPPDERFAVRPDGQLREHVGTGRVPADVVLGRAVCRRGVRA
jgi:hypothetical protein